MNDELTERLTQPPEGFDQERWEVTDDDAAAWALRKLHAAQAERDRIKRNAAAEIVRIEDAETDALAEPDRDIAFFTERLIAYRRRLEADNPKLPKTYKLPNGSIRRRAGSKSVRVTDSDGFVTWAHTAAPELLSMEPRVSHMAKWDRRTDDDGQTVIVSPDGEQVPGVVEVKGPDTYSVLPADISPEPF